MACVRVPECNINSSTCSVRRQWRADRCRTDIAVTAHLFSAIFLHGTIRLTVRYQQLFSSHLHASLGVSHLQQSRQLKDFQGNFTTGVPFDFSLSQHLS
jgi:hypothetical protein